MILLYISIGQFVNLFKFSYDSFSVTKIGAGKEKVPTYGF